MSSMTYLVVTMLSVASLLGSSVSCSRSDFIAGDADTHTEVSNIADDTKGTQMKIRIGSKVFNAILFDNPTATAFKARLPLTVNMDELNGNEKKYDFSESFPTNSSKPKAINNGDLMVWGSKTLVLFYKTFPTSYTYTKLGRITDPSGLEAVVGTGNVTVTFTLDRSPQK